MKHYRVMWWSGQEAYFTTGWSGKAMLRKY